MASAVVILQHRQVVVLHRERRLRVDLEVVVVAGMLQR
jgi:hypothetical protein